MRFPKFSKQFILVSAQSQHWKFKVNKKDTRTKIHEYKYVFECKIFFECVNVSEYKIFFSYRNVTNTKNF